MRPITYLKAALADRWKAIKQEYERRRGLMADQSWRYVKFWGIGIGVLLMALFGGVFASLFDLPSFLVRGPDAALVTAPLEAYVAYNVPDTMTLGRGRPIAFIIRSRGLQHSELVGQVRRLAGDSSVIVEIDTLPITGRMSVRLAGGAFDIVPHSNETQLVSPGADWLWEVYPRERGEDKLLTLTVSHLYDVGGRETPHDSQIVRREVVVRVGFLRAVSDFMKSNWYWLWPFVLAPLAYIGRNQLKGIARKLWNRLRKLWNRRAILGHIELVPPEEEPASTGSSRVVGPLQGRPSMRIEKLTSLALRLFFVGALLVLALAVIEKGLNLIGQGGIPGVSPAQLLRWSVVLLIFVIAILLRQIRDQRK